MNSISSTIKDAFSTIVRILNQPIAKESVKNVAGCVTLTFGIVEVYDIYQILHGREMTTETYPDYPKWVQIANKIVIVCAKISLVLSAGVSRPGIFIISSLAGSVFSSHQLEKVFGPNTTFAVNPWHPRHVVSIAAVVLALPALGQSIYKGARRVYSKIQEQSFDASIASVWLTDKKIRLMNLFNTVTSRPCLHIGNQLARFILRPV